MTAASSIKGHRMIVMKSRRREQKEDKARVVFINKSIHGHDSQFQLIFVKLRCQAAAGPCR